MRRKASGGDTKLWVRSRSVTGTIAGGTVTEKKRSAVVMPTFCVRELSGCCFNMPAYNVHDRRFSSSPSVPAGKYQHPPPHPVLGEFLRKKKKMTDVKTVYVL